MGTDMAEARICSDCGTPLTGESQGFCPTCMLEGALALGQGPNSEEQTAVLSTVTEQLGTVIGRYKLLQQIGEGGGGVVYMAEQQEPVRRKVALKIIKLGMDTKQVVARFEAERQALAMMDHPNIARVFDGGATEQGRPFFVMELVCGSKITEYCDRHQLPTRERLELFIQVCQAVQHAHQKGIIHRDLKPSNILVTVNDGVAIPKVIDFGVAKATEQRLTEKTVFTAFNAFVGTPAYMSPEQAKMTSLDIDTRSDIYSLGVLLYELLTGRTPFDHHDLLQSGIDELRRAIREQEPLRPSTCLRTLTSEDLTTTARHRRIEAPRLISSLRGDLDWIVMKCLEKDRTRRYETANAFAQDIRRYLADEPVIASAPSARYRFGKFARRNKTALTVAVAVAAILVVATLASMWQAIRATRAEELARQRVLEVAAERDSKEKARQEAEAISTFLTEVFQSPDPEHNGRTVTVAETLDGAARKLDTLARQPAPRVKLQTTLGKTYHALGLDRDAIPLLEKARDYCLATLGPEHPETLRAMGSLADSYFDAGRYEEAFKLREEVLALRRKVLGPEHPDTLVAMHCVAISYFHAGHREEAFKLWEEVLTLRRKVNGLEHPDTLLAMHYVANSHAEAGRRKEALKLREEVLALRGKVNGLEHPETLRAMGSQADSYFNAGRREEALKLREEVLALCRKVFGREHPATLSAMGTLANSYHDVGRREEALKLREEVLALRRKVLGPENNILWAMHYLAESYFDAGRREEALKLREEVLALRRKVLGSEHPETLWATDQVANSYHDAGRRDEALQLREEVLAIRRKIFGPENPDTLWAMHYLAISYFDAGRREEALKLREEVLALRRKVFGPEHPETLSAMDDLVISYYDAGRRREALKLEEAVRRKVLGAEHLPPPSR